MLTDTGIRCFSFADAREAVIDSEVVANDLQRRFYRITFAVEDCRMVASFTSREAADIFAYKYGDLLLGFDPTRHDALQFFIVDAGEELRIWSDPNRALIVSGKCIQAHIIAFFADNAIMHEYIEQRNCISLHAAVLALGEQACAIIGVSTAGKSTTAVACALQGLSFLSDERCLLRAGLAHPFPRALTLRPNGRRRLLVDDTLLSAFIGATLRAADEKDDFVVLPSQLLPSVRTNAARLRAIFVISGYAERPQSMQVGLFDVLPELMLGMTARERGLDRMARAIHEFQNAVFYRLTLGTPGATAHMIANTLKALSGVH